MNRSLGGDAGMGSHDVESRLTIRLEEGRVAALGGLDGQ